MSDQITNIRHTLAHLLAHAVQDNYASAKFAIGPTIDQGFYYDIEVDRPLKPEDLKMLEKRMKYLIKQRLSMVRIEPSSAGAVQYLARQPYKQEILADLKAKGEAATFYQIGSFIDLCRGGHVANTAEIDPNAFMLTHIAGAYWRGDSNRPMLQRIYGAAFATPPELTAYQAQQVEAAKRDHKKLGPELDLFTFSELVGSGLPLWTPRGTLVRNLLDGFVWELRQAAGYERVEIPHITKAELYERSGHWQKFHDELFKITTREGHTFAMKPMNCPHHTQIYARRQHSYRELPQRFANTTMCYRDEQSGELSGISRIRSFTQDDAHVFCRTSQAAAEIRKIWKIVNSFYRVFGFDLKVRLSLHDPAQPEKYLGDEAQWQVAEKALRAVVKSAKTKVNEVVGEAAFYGPKIDFMASDSMGREWQMATIQLDMNLPARFDLSCVNERGEHERIVMIHAAIMGSIERFLSILIEHYAGAFPFWLSPVQIQIIPVAFKHNANGRKLLTIVSQAGLRASLDTANETVGSKIRRAEKMKVPYMVVLGDQERTLKRLAVRTRGKSTVAAVSLATWIKKLSSLRDRRSATLA